MAARKLAAEKALAKRMVRDLLSQLTFISKPSQAGGDLALQENLKLTNARVEELNHRLSHMSAGAASDCIAVPLTATPPYAPPLPSEQVPAPNEQLVQRHPATSVPQISTFPATSSSAPTRTIILGDGTELTFTEADVGSPPLTGFADDVAGLNRMWDDTTPNWGGTSVLEIKGHPIPIVYWKDVYMNSNRGFPWKPRQWHGMKSKWFNWKVSFFFRSLNAVLFKSQLYRLLCIATAKERPPAFGTSFHITGSSFASRRSSNAFQSFARMKTRPQLNVLGLSTPPTFRLSFRTKKRGFLTSRPSLRISRRRIDYSKGFLVEIQMVNIQVHK